MVTREVGASCTGREYPRPQGGHFFFLLLAFLLAALLRGFTEALARRIAEPSEEPSFKAALATRAQRERLAGVLAFLVCRVASEARHGIRQSYSFQD